MPDAHMGYGMPIVGVLFADGAVVQYAIGSSSNAACPCEGGLTVETNLASEIAATLAAIAAGQPRC